MLAGHRLTSNLVSLAELGPRARWSWHKPIIGYSRPWRNADRDSRTAGAPSFAPPTTGICPGGLVRVAFWRSEGSPRVTRPAERAYRLIGRLMARKGEMGAVRNLD